jgi:hypothetical protein
LEPTAFVPSVWPSSFPLTCLQLHKVLSILYVPLHSWTEATSTWPPELGVLGVQYRLAPPIFHTFRRPWSRLWPCIYRNWFFLNKRKTSQKTLTRYQNIGNFFLKHDE